MNQLNIFSEKTKIGDLAFDLRQFNIPKTFYADFRKAQAKYLYENVNGESERTDTISKFIVPVYDNDVVKIMESAGQSCESLKAREISVLSGFDAIQNLMDEEYCGVVKMHSLRIIPKWVDAGYGGAYSDIQVVAERIEKNGNN